MSDKWRAYMAFILPVIIVVVYLKGYYDLFAPMSKKVYSWVLNIGDFSYTFSLPSAVIIPLIVAVSLLVAVFAIVFQKKSEKQ